MMRELKYFIFPALIFFSFALQIHYNFVCEYIPVLLLLFSSDLFKPFRSRFIRGIPVSQTSWSERMECSWNRLFDRLFFLYIRCNASLSWYLPSFCFFTFLSKSVASLIDYTAQSCFLGEKDSALIFGAYSVTSLKFPVVAKWRFFDTIIGFLLSALEEDIIGALVAPRPSRWCLSFGRNVSSVLTSIGSGSSSPFLPIPLNKAALNQWTGTGW